MEDGVEGFRSVRGKEVATGRAAVTVQDHFAVAVQEHGEFRNDFFGKLVGPIDIIGADNDDWQFEGFVVGVYNHFSGGFGGGVGVGGAQDGGFQKIGAVSLDFTIHFVGGYVDEALDAGIDRALEQDVGSKNIVVCKCIRVAKGQVDM